MYIFYNHIYIYCIHGEVDLHKPLGKMEIVSKGQRKWSEINLMEAWLANYPPKRKHIQDIQDITHQFVQFNVYHVTQSHLMTQSLVILYTTIHHRVWRGMALLSSSHPRRSRTCSSNTMLEQSCSGWIGQFRTKPTDSLRYQVTRVA